MNKVNSLTDFTLFGVSQKYGVIKVLVNLISLYWGVNNVRA